MNFEKRPKKAIELESVALTNYIVIMGMKNISTSTFHQE